MGTRVVLRHHSQAVVRWTSHRTTSSSCRTATLHPVRVEQPHDGCSNGGPESLLLLRRLRRSCLVVALLLTHSVAVTRYAVRLFGCKRGWLERCGRWQDAADGLLSMSGRVTWRHVQMIAAQKANRSPPYLSLRPQMRHHCWRKLLHAQSRKRCTPKWRSESDAAARPLTGGPVVVGHKHMVLLRRNICDANLGQASHFLSSHWSLAQFFDRTVDNNRRGRSLKMP
jgi:hypothetical protein